MGIMKKRYIEDSPRSEKSAEKKGRSSLFWIMGIVSFLLGILLIVILVSREGSLGKEFDSEMPIEQESSNGKGTIDEDLETEPAHIHSIRIQEAISAKCEETGLSEGKFCADCDAVLEEQTVISALGHDYVDRKCSRCQKIYYSSGLTYERIQEGYSVISGLGTCTDIDLFIPPETPEGDYVIGIASKAFKDQAKLKTVELPEGMTSIGSEAFAGCGSLEEIIIPDSVTQVGFSAFSECCLLKHTEYDHGFYLGNKQNPYVLLTDINDDSGLMHVLIHGKTRVIGDSAFAGCRGLESVTIPDSIETINLNAFGDCISLKTVNYTGTTGEWLSIDIAEGNQPLKDAEVRCLAQDVPEISGTCGTHVMWAFDTVSGLLMVWGDGSMAWASETTPWDEYRDRIESVVIKEGVTNVAEKAFLDCVNLKSVHLSDTVTAIDSEAFQSCANLVSITIPSSVTSIRENAFSGCTNIRSLVLGESLTHIGENALNGVKDVTFRLVPPSLLNSIIPSGANSITLDISNLEGTLDGVVFVVPETVGYFALIGDGDTYSDFRIQSNAGETLISKLGIAGSKDTPLWLNSSVVTLRDVTVLDVPGFALVMPADHTVLKLIGSTTVGSRNEYSVLSGQVTLEEGSNTLEGSLSLTGKYMVYGDVSNRQLIHGSSDPDIVLIDAAMFSNMLTFSPVMFDAEEGTVDTEKIQVRYGHPYGELPVPQRTYYTFLGWFTDPESGDQVMAETIAPAMAEQTLYAHWKLNTFTVTFVYDYDGAPVSSESKTMTCGVAFNEVPNPSRAHYTFGGWYTEFGTAITADTVMHEAKDITVYAKWTIIAYNVNWKTDVGYTITVKRTSSPNAKAPTGNLSSGAKIYYGDVLSVEYSAITGYALASQGISKITVSGDVTTANIYATANVKSYTVSWKTDIGYTISVKRVSSALKGASSGVLSNGSTVYHGDVLSVSYQKQDYYTIQSKGAETITVSGNVNSSSIYATASLNPISTQWVLASEKPAGAEVVETKWTYTRTETVESRETTLSGWTQVGSYWNQIGTGTSLCVMGPINENSEINWNHSAFNGVNKAPYEERVTETQKRTVTNTNKGYIYWHWMHACGNSAAGEDYFRNIFYRSGWDATSSMRTMRYDYFGAFRSTKDYPVYNSGESPMVDKKIGLQWYKVPTSDRYTYADTQGSMFWYRLSYGESTYVDYERVFQYRRITNDIDSAVEIYEGGEITNVQKWVKYRAK